MYWHELNQKRVAQLSRWLEGKSLIVVGNSVKMMQSSYGELIDSYDVVVRLGKGLTDPTLYVTLGKKTNIWFSGMLRAGLYNRVRCDWKILTPSTSAAFDDHNLFVPVNKALFKDDFQPYKHYFWSDSIEQTKLYWTTLGFNKDTRPSQGLVCCDFLARRAAHKNINVIGFDFFTEKLEIAGTAHTSWHMPTKTGNPQDLPHHTDIERSTMQYLVDTYGIKLLPYNN